MLGKREHVRMAEDFGSVEWDAARMAAPDKYERAVFEEYLHAQSMGLDETRVSPHSCCTRHFIGNVALGKLHLP